VESQGPARWEDNPRVTGICILRVESDGGGELLISLVAAADVDESSSESRTTEMFTSVSDAVAAVEAFLRTLEHPPDSAPTA
jgi:hypothetical protein